jgi:uncharacterized membrane protein
MNVRSLGRFIVPAIALLYVAARLWQLTSTCLWFDEIFGVHAAEHSWRQLFQFVALDLVHPPLFYCLLKLWIAIGGESLVWLRLLPFIISVLAIAPFLLICRELALSRFGTATAFLLFAVNGAAIKYTQEVRMYSLLIFLVLLSIWLFLRLRVDARFAIALSLVNALLVSTHYFGWLIVLTEVSVLLLKYRRPLKEAVLVIAVPFLATVVWLTIIAANRGNEELSQNIGWMTRPGFGELWSFVLMLAEPFYFQRTSADPVSMFWISVPMLVLLALAVTLGSTSRDKMDPARRDQVPLILTFVLAPLVVTLALSWIFPFSIWGNRHLVIVLPAMFILVGLMFERIGRVWKIGLVVPMAAMILVGGLAATDRKVDMPAWCGWDKLAEQKEHANTRPAVAVEDLAAYHVWFSLRKTSPGPEIIKLSDVPGVQEDSAYFIPRGFDGIRRQPLDKLDLPEFDLYYRAGKIDVEQPPLNSILAKGYSISERAEVVGRGEAAIRLTLVRNK